MSKMKLAAALTITGLLAASSLALGAAGASSEPRVVYRTVRLANPQRPPELYSVLPSGRSRRLLVRGAEQPAWSPRRKRIAFARSRVGQEGIWVMNADGSGQRRLTMRPGDGDPTWSPDGRLIVYRSSSPTSFDLWVVPSGGGKPKPLLVTPQANELEPDWSPDGRRVTFQGSRGGTIQIWVLNLSSRQARRLTSGRDSFSPDWAPDGRRVAYATGGQIAVVNADTRARRLLPSGAPRSADDPSWSPDGRRIVFQRGGQVLSMRAGGGDLHYVTRAAWGTNGEPDW